MAGELIWENVNLNLFPEIDKQHVADAKSQITIGDLHSNAIKLLYVLLKHSIATGIDAEEYAELVKIYNLPTDSISAEYLQKFDALIAKLQFKTTCLLRLIGDELCDRGSNDYFVLSILEKLYQARVPTEVLLSNHGFDFICAAEADSEKLLPKMLIQQHAGSLFNLNTLIEKKLVDKAKIINISKTANTHFLKILSYSLTEANDGITIYTHAPTGVSTIRALAEHFKVEYNETSALTLAATIDAINDEFKKHVANNTVNTLGNRDVLYKAYRYHHSGPDPEKKSYRVFNVEPDTS